MPAAATAKRSAGAKGKANAKAKAASTNGAGAHRRSAEATLELAKSIKAMREDGKSWDEVKDKLGVDPAQGQYLIKVASVRPKDRIKFESESDLAKQAKALRKDGLSKAEIAARAGVSVAKIRNLLGAESASVKAARSAAKPAAKAAPKGKAATKPAPKAKATRASAGKADAANGAGGAGDQPKPKVRRRKRAQVAQDPSGEA